jgi:hypothetical protein
MKLASRGEFVEMHTGRSRNIQRSPCNYGNKVKTVNLGWMLYLLDAVLSACCTQCILYSVYGALSVCCTQY